MHKQPLKQRFIDKSQKSAKSVRELVERIIRIIKAEMGGPGKGTVTLGANLDGMQAPSSTLSHPEVLPILRFDEFDVQHLDDQTSKGESDYICFKRRVGFRTRFGPVSRVGTEMGSTIMAEPKIRMSP